MKLILEPTSKIIEIDGVPCRVWQGHSESGVPCHAHIALIAVNRDADAEDFNRELREVAAPRADVGDLPARMTLVK